MPTEAFTLQPRPVIHSKSNSLGDAISGFIALNTQAR